jgi:hypothetical protein
MGRLRIKDFKTHFWGRVAIGRPDECWEWTGATNTSGYGVTAIPGRKGLFTSHRVAFMLASGLADLPGQQVLHGCDNPQCCNPAHLHPGTQAENIAERDARGRTAIGERNGNHKLTEQNARDILVWHAITGNQVDIARAYRVSPQAVHKIVHGENWSYLQKEVVDATEIRREL